MRRHPARAAAWLTIGALIVLPVAACGSGSGSSASTADEISISTGGCGGDWHLDHPGWHTFQLHNSASDAAEVELVNPANGAVYDDIENLGAGTTAPLRLDVGSGS